MNRELDVLGRILLRKGDPADRERGYWSIDKVGEMTSYDTPGCIYASATYTDVDYFMRCPYCDKMLSVHNIALISRDGRALHEEYSYVLDCIACNHCGRHYWVNLAGMTKVLQEAHNFIAR